MTGFRVIIPLSRDLHQQQQQRRARLQQSQNVQLSITGADDEANTYNPMMPEASPPPQYQPNSAGTDPDVTMNMLVEETRGRGRPRKHALVNGETSQALVPGSPSFMVSHRSGSGDETSLSLVPGGPSFVVSHPRGSGGETSLSLVPGGPPFAVSHPRGSGRETSLSLVPGGPSFTVSHPRGSGGETSLALVTGGPSFTVSPPSGSRGRVKKMRARRGPPSSSANNDKHQALGSTGVGVGFTPHIFTILPGEDVGAKIMELNMNGQRSVCIFSAYGCISSVTLRHPTTSGGTVAYEGIFDIISLSGSFVPMEVDGYRNMTGGLSISLSRLDNAIFGGSVVGPLVAATPVQVVVGSFMIQEGQDLDKPDHPRTDGYEKPASSRHNE